ncbi:MAG: hypothetical protein JSV32_07125 [Dehalococcoidia bacterium]|nr:MAG: hypothetical protein JSV32_07125 [Dehalococcoidia bacterium]
MEEVQQEQEVTELIIECTKLCHSTEQNYLEFCQTMREWQAALDNEQFIEESLVITNPQDLHITGTLNINFAEAASNAAME